MTPEDLQDHRRAIHDLGPGGLLQVSGLRWRDLVVDQHDLHVRPRASRCVGRPVGRLGVAIVV